LAQVIVVHLGPGDEEVDQRRAEDVLHAFGGPNQKIADPAREVVTDVELPILAGDIVADDLDLRQTATQPGFMRQLSSESPGSAPTSPPPHRSHLIVTGQHQVLHHRVMVRG
jgi:hypothetical protein